ncbi:hypothetical protein CPB86DRAFT_798870 [Serendipita vermifera]|nr:hypothetical protein CPB86DRAFT_798870 [Serendipita vermifera]
MFAALSGTPVKEKLAAVLNKVMRLTGGKGGVQFTLGVALECKVFRLALFGLLLLCHPLEYRGQRSEIKLALQWGANATNAEQGWARVVGLQFDWQRNRTHTGASRHRKLPKSNLSILFISISQSVLSPAGTRPHGYLVSTVNTRPGT